MKPRLVGFAAAGTIALAFALGFGPHERVLALIAYVDLLAALVLIGFAASIGGALPRLPHLRHRRRRRAARPPRPLQLERLERQLSDPASFRQLVVQIASTALARKHGVVLEREPERGRALLGERVWEVVAGPKKLRRDELERVLADLETLE